MGWSDIGLSCLGSSGTVVRLETPGRSSQRPESPVFFVFCSPACVESGAESPQSVSYFLLLSGPLWPEHLGACCAILLPLVECDFTPAYSACQEQSARYCVSSVSLVASLGSA